MTQKNYVQFSINGQLYKVSGEQVSPHAKLIDFIRDEAQLKGTKYLCRQGGCGACVVSVTQRDPLSLHPNVRSVNSCLTPVLSCDGWDVWTVEGLGDKQKGYDALQVRLAQFAGTQCGFCTPGMIMTMKSLMEKKGDNLKMFDIENCLDGNICRCTGYRPILDAFKSFASDAPAELKQKCTDIEDCLQCPCPVQDKSTCSQRDKCCMTNSPSPLPSDLTVLPISKGRHWIKVHALQSLYEQLQQNAKRGDKYRLVAGNTGIGIFKEDLGEDLSKLFIDISSIPDLLRSSFNSQEITLGAGLSISDAITTLNAAANYHDDFHYAKTIASHFQNRVGNVHIRNTGTLGGNLMLKHDHPGFASDIWLLFEAAGAKVNIGCSVSHQSRLFTIQEMLEKNLDGKVLLSFHLPPLQKEFVLKSYKVSLRYQNSKGYTNCALLFRVLPLQNFRVLQKPTLLFGGLGIPFSKAKKAEEFLNGKSLNDTSTVQGALEILDKEMESIPTESNKLSGSVEYRKGLVKSLLYKAILSIVGKDCGGNALTRGLRSGRQAYVKDKASKEVLYKGFPKLEAVLQCSGEAEYTNDVPQAPGELFGAFVLATVGNATLDTIDTTAALSIPGVVRFIGAADIPGPNNYMIWEPSPEPIFVSSKVDYAGQPAGLILAKTRDAAFLGAKKVSISYKDVQKPILTIDDSLTKAKNEGKLDELRVRTVVSPKDKDDPNSNSSSSLHSISGEFRVGGQHHFQMEPHSTLCIPTEDGLKVFSATQWIDKTQAAIASALNIPVNNIQVQVRRVGGGFGGKATRSGLTAVACAVAAQVTNKPVRVTLDLETHMRAMGKKLPYFISYDVAFDNSGKISSLNADVFCDPGFSPNEETTWLFAMCVQNCYEANEGWNVKLGRTLTNTPANTFCRVPGMLQGSATIEVIMEHIAFALKKNPWEVRMANMMLKGSAILASPGQILEQENPLVSLIQEFKKETDYEKRVVDVEEFNKKSRWVKRGLGLVPIRFPNHFIYGKYEVFVGIHHIDGSVVVAHGGIEMGQGINTKVAQTVASFLEIPLEKIKVRPTSNFVTPNSSLTAAGTTSESCCFAAAEACKILKEKMKPVKTDLPDAPWEKVVTECHKRSIELTTSFMNECGKDKLNGYDVNSLCITEVEIDVLTGEYQILRLDCSIDGTRSLNPEVDLGQVEGGLIFGLGIWTTERLEYDTTTGQLLTANTWDYKPPMAKDIPQDFRVTLYSDPQPNKDGVLGSKGPGEPSGCSAVAVLIALRQAIASARRDAGNNEWFQLNGPVTPEDVFRLSLTSHTLLHI